MVITPRPRKALAHDHFVGHMRKVELMAKYGISFPTVQKILGQSHNRYLLSGLIAHNYLILTPRRQVDLATSATNLNR